jgi:hypothetical protein
VLEIQLSGKYTGQERKYLAGKGEGKYSVADMACWRKFYNPILSRINTNHTKHGSTDGHTVVLSQRRRWMAFLIY